MSPPAQLQDSAAAQVVDLGLDLLDTPAQA